MNTADQSIQDEIDKQHDAKQIAEAKIRAQMAHEHRLGVARVDAYGQGRMLGLIETTFQRIDVISNDLAALMRAVVDMPTALSPELMERIEAHVAPKEAVDEESIAVLQERIRCARLLLRDNAKAGSVEMILSGKEPE